MTLRQSTAPFRRARSMAVALLLVVAVSACSDSAPTPALSPEVEQLIASLERRVTDLEHELAELRQRVIAPTAASWAMRSDDVAAEAEAYLVSDQVTAVVGTQLLEPSCETPAVTEVGALVMCEATGMDGSVWDLEIEITRERELTLADGAPRS